MARLTLLLLAVASITVSDDQLDEPSPVVEIRFDGLELHLFSNKPVSIRTIIYFYKRMFLKSVRIKVDEIVRHEV